MRVPQQEGTASKLERHMLNEWRSYGCESKTLGLLHVWAAVPRHNRLVTESPGLRQSPLRQGSLVGYTYSRHLRQRFVTTGCDKGVCNTGQQDGMFDPWPCIWVVGWL